MGRRTVNVSADGARCMVKSVASMYSGEGRASSTVIIGTETVARHDMHTCVPVVMWNS
jgi:hypothetical protein